MAQFNKPIPVALLVSAGLTDLRYVVYDENHKPTKSADLKPCRPAHEWLLRNQDKWKMAEPEDEIQNLRPPRQQQKNGKSPEGGSQKFGWEGSDNPCDACKQTLMLVSSKLSNILVKLKESSDKRLIRIVGGLVLYTDRDRDGPGRDEPIALGPILAKWIGTYFGLTAAKVEEIEIPDPRYREIGYYSFLQAKENWDTSEGNLNEAMKKRLEIAVRRMSEWPEKPWLMAAVVGGFPELKSYLPALADVYFQDRWRPLKNPEQASAALVPVPNAGAPYVGDTEAVQARANALRLLRKWDVHGARAAAVHLPQDRGGVWLKVLDCLDDYWAGLGARKSGHPEFDSALAALMANPLGWMTRKADSQGVTDTIVAAPLRLALAGFRVECALRERRIAEALNWTYTFYNAMLLDLIEYLARIHLANNGLQFVRLDWKYREIICNTKNFEMRDVTLFSTATTESWFSFEHTRLFYNEFAMFVPSKAFSKLNGLLSQSARWKEAFLAIAKPTCKDLRNQNTHEILDAVKSNRIILLLKQAGIWGDDKPLLTAVGTEQAKNCLDTFYGNSQGYGLLDRIKAVHTAAMSALLDG